MNDKKPFLNFRRCCVVFVFTALGVRPEPLPAQHVHVNAGATSTEPGAPLFFANASTYDTNSLTAFPLTLAATGSFSNLHHGAGVTFTALPSSLNNGGPAPGHAANGSFLQLQFVSVSGPPNGEFGVWMQEPGNPSVSHQLFATPAGTANGTNLLVLSESDGSPEDDPYGHIHGVTFTATKPGLYVIGCRVVDTSTHGPGGGPIHTPSQLYHFYFQAGLTISSWVKEGDSFSATFGTALGKTYYVEATPNLVSANWSAFAGPLAGNNRLQTAQTNSSAPQLFFRIRSN